MPSRERIDKFLSTLNALGHEPEILENRGQRLESVKQPDEGLSQDLAELLSGFDTAGIDDDAPPEGPSPEPAAEEPGGFGADLELDLDSSVFGRDAEAPAPVEPPLPDEFAIPEEFQLPQEGGLETAPDEDFEVPPGESRPPEPGLSAPDGEEFTFEEESGPAVSRGAPAAPPAVAEMDAVDIEEPGFGDVGAAEEFSLGDFGTQFGLVDEAGADEADLNPASAVPENVPAPAVVESEGGGLTEAQFTALQKNLQTLPRNLKLLIEDLVGGNKASEDQQLKLVTLVASGAAVQTIADLTGKLLGRTIQVPKGYEKRTGIAFEAERRSLAYAFRENILPIVRIVAVAVMAAGVLSYAGYNFVYKPIHAASLFQQGYRLGEAERYTEANRLFGRAFAIWADREWFFRYADLYVRKRRFDLAAEKYDQLLALYADWAELAPGADPRNLRPDDIGIRRKRPKDGTFKRGVLTYAEMESDLLENFEKADRILELLLQESFDDYDGLLARGDNFLRWGDLSRERFEDARRNYAMALDRHGDTDEVLFRFLVYFIRADNFEEVRRLTSLFESDKGLKVDPARYAELGGYLLSRGETEKVEDILFRAMRVEAGVPEIHYHLARLYRNQDKRRDEAAALENSARLFEEAEKRRATGLTRRRTKMYIDVFNRIGENLYRDERYFEAEEKWVAGLVRYEAAVQRRQLPPDPELARLYVNLGDLYYYQRKDFSAALEQYTKAEANYLVDHRVNYRKGFIHYRAGNYASAVEEFLKAEETYRKNRNLLYAIAAAMFQRQDYFAAEGYYSLLVDRLTLDRQSLGDRFQPDEQPEHRALVELLIRAHNNYGVTLHRVGERGNRKDKLTAALVELTNSAELYENFHRDRETGGRTGTKTLAQLNLRALLYPLAEFTPQIYATIPLDLESDVL